MRVKVEVKQKHIRNARKVLKNFLVIRSAKCPVAQALCEKLNTENVRAYGSRGLIDGNFVDFPQNVLRFISKFDLNKPVKPFNFFVEVPNGE